MRSNKYEYDAFISHAVEDKIPIANELCAKLERAGLKIWYSGKELGIGDSIEKTIEKGLNRSRYGIVIFSPTYLAKNWTIREFYTLLAKEIEEQKVILPVLFNITLDELKNKDLLMADRFAVNADRGIDFVVERLMREIRKTQPVKVKEAWFSKMWFMLILSLLVNVSLLLKGALFSDSTSAFDSAESFDSSTHPVSPVHKSTLLGEMQGLFDQLNTCTCNRPEENQPRRFRQARLVRNPDSPADGSFYREETPPERGSTRLAGSRITMAVVLQVEPRPETAHDVEQDFDDVLTTFSLSKQNNSGPPVGSQEIQEKAGSHKCTHSHNPAE